MPILAVIFSHLMESIVMPYKHTEMTGTNLNAFYQVYNTLGSGFLEKVYENTLAHELRK